MIETEIPRVPLPPFLSSRPLDAVREFHDSHYG